MRIYSELGQGTAMCLDLPRHVGETPDDEPARAAGAIESRDGDTVLVIEDEATIRMLLV